MSGKTTVSQDVIAQLINADAWLVRCGADKVPMDGGWLDHPWTGEGARDEVSNVPGRHRRFVCDVDPKGDTPAERELDRMQKVSEVVKVFGPALFTVDTPSGGVHLYYALSGGHEPVGNLKTTFGDVRCDNGHAVLWGDGAQRLLDSLLDIPVTEDQVGLTREEVLERLKPFLLTQPEVSRAGGRRGRVEGDRNQGTFVRTRCATERDTDPAPAIESALTAALEAGLPPKEAAKAAAQGVRYGQRKRTEERERLEKAFKPPEDDGELVLDTRKVAREDVAVVAGGYAHKHPTDSLMLSQDFVARTGAVGRYVRVKRDKRWLVWVDGCGWEDDVEGVDVLGAMQEFGRTRLYTKGRSGKLVQDKIAGGRQGLARDAVRLLPRIPGMAIEPSRLDGQPHLLGLPGGLLYDLSTGAIRDARPTDYVRKRVAAPPCAYEGRVIERLVKAMFPEQGVQDALQAILGAFLWGGPLLHVILFIVGRTRGGKTSLLKLLAAALGSYATTMKSDTLTTRATGDTGFGIDNANAMLRGVRLAVMSEIPRRRKLDPARVNELTGGDALVSRRIGGDLVTTQATHSIVFAMNDLPRIDVVDSEETALAMFERLRIFEVREKLDPALGAEAAAALSDPVELGATCEWLLTGVNRPVPPLHPRLKSALSEYWSSLVWEE